MKTIAVVGKNFGDEGKGLVAAGLCSFSGNSLVVRHNGGAQSGHTVENITSGKRFIHHQIGSGAEYGAHTLLAASFHPDLYQIGNEIEAFRNMFGFSPAIFAEAEASITTIDDIIINMAIETLRGNSRHGSCGMGINECCERINAGYGITIREAADLSEKQLTEKLDAIRREYSIKRAEQLGIDPENPYRDMLANPDITANFAEAIHKNVREICLTEADRTMLSSYDRVIFESGQGLLLDTGFTAFAPHLTSSRTGIAEPLNFLTARGLSLDEVIYVTRPYVTRHGAGPLPCECGRCELTGVAADKTNIPNDWQGEIRYARHVNMEDFIGPLKNDCGCSGLCPSLAVTHLDETDYTMYFSGGDIPFEEFVSLTGDTFRKIYISADRQNIRELR